MVSPPPGGGGADQLQRAVERNEYAECAQLIEAVQQLAGHFQSFVAIPKVAELSARVATLQRSVQARPPARPPAAPSDTSCAWAGVFMNEFISGRAFSCG